MSISYVCWDCMEEDADIEAITSRRSAGGNACLNESTEHPTLLTTAAPPAILCAIARCLCNCTPPSPMPDPDLHELWAEVVAGSGTTRRQRLTIRRKAGRTAGSLAAKCHLRQGLRTAPVLVVATSVAWAATQQLRGTVCGPVIEIVTRFMEIIRMCVAVSAMGAGLVTQPSTARPHQLPLRARRP